MLKKIFNSQSKSVTFAAALLAVSALLSGLLGLIRDRLLAGTFGAGQELDIYFAAFRIPDFIYAILIAGGIAVLFLPVFSEYFKKNEEDAWQFASNLFNCFLVLLVVFCGIMAIFAPWLMDLVAPGFSLANKSLAVALTRIMFLSPVFFGLASIFSGILHYFNRFLVYSLAPVVYNLGIIFGILFLVPRFGLYGLAFGVILGALFYWLIQIPSAKDSGYKYSFSLNFKESGIVKVFKLMIPRTIGAAAYNINLIVVTAIASTLAVGSIAVFSFANNLQYLPIGIIGISFSIAAFPLLSKSWASDLKEDFKNVFSSTFRQIIFLIIPIALLVFILRDQIVQIVLQTGQFSGDGARLTSACLGVFCLSIIGLSLIPLFARVFYSFHDTKTPMFTSLLTVALNIGLCYFFSFLLGFQNSFQEFFISFLDLKWISDIRVVGLPLALSASSIFQFFFLLFLLKRKIPGLVNGEILQSFWKIILSSVLMMVFVWLSLAFSSAFFDFQSSFSVLIQTTTAVLVGLAAYVFCHILFKSPELKTIWSALCDQFKKN
ncbi:MAG: murein biosynthesis integral membrane protein MurJ [Candidatus Nealsonbacteria bacterium]|nr:murein biosynthesis integral membrane protein MurJ [Candidatus Nealsonbacteria bacterium]